MTTKTAPLLDGDDVLTWLRMELPHWACADIDGHPVDHPAHRWSATSPTVDLDGITVSAEDPLELVERVRLLERLIALAAGRGGSVQVTTVAGVDLGDPETLDRVRGVLRVARATEVRAPVRSRPGPPPVPWRGEEGREPPARTTPRFDPTAVGPPTEEGLQTAREYARTQGYTGDPCFTCGSLSTRYSGTCLVCDSCGSTSGCS